MGRSETPFVVITTGNGLMGTAEKGPAEMKETRKWRFFKQAKEESTNLRDAERDHHGQANPRFCLKALRLREGACGREAFPRFFSSSCCVCGMCICLCPRKTPRKAAASMHELL